MNDTIQPNKEIVNSLRSNDYQKAGQLMLTDIMSIEHGKGAPQEKAKLEELYIGQVNSLAMNDQKVRAMGFPGFVEVFQADEAFLVLDANHNRKLDASDPRVSLVGTDLGDKLMHKPLDDRSELPSSPKKASATENSYGTETEKSHYPEPIMVAPEKTNVYQANVEGNNFGPRNPRTGAINLDAWLSNPTGAIIYGSTGPQTLRYAPASWDAKEAGCETQIRLPANLPLNQQIDCHVVNARANQRIDMIHGKVVIENGQKVFQGSTDRRMPDGKFYNYPVTIQLTEQKR